MRMKQGPHALFLPRKPFLAEAKICDNIREAAANTVLESRSGVRTLYN